MAPTSPIALPSMRSAPNRLLWWNHVSACSWVDPSGFHCCLWMQRETTKLLKMCTMKWITGKTVSLLPSWANLSGCTVSSVVNCRIFFVDWGRLLPFSGFSSSALDDDEQSTSLCFLKHSNEQLWIDFEIRFLKFIDTISNWLTSIACNEGIYISWIQPGTPSTSSSIMFYATRNYSVLPSMRGKAMPENVKEIVITYLFVQF